MIEYHPFKFKKFEIAQDRCIMKVGTDGVLLGAWSDIQDVKFALDIGTGTGIIALMIAQRTRTAQIHAIDIDQEAFDQTKENMDKSIWKERLLAHFGPIQDFAKSTSIKFDLIVSNPPFFTGGTFSDMTDRNSVRHTIKLPHGDLLRSARNLLAPNGRFSVILPYIEGLRFIELASSYNLFPQKITNVYPKSTKNIERLLIELKRNPTELIKDDLILHEEDGKQYTPAFKALTADFYLNH
jgi:tRNA1Val (adenine37-N6)-methyltransferase